MWPLIHYHKFLAKCIKKLKRNGVDVKHTVSPVAVFLREEVCAVSDHLAAVSLFDSEEWIACLPHFKGWILLSEEAQAGYRQFIAKLPLRSIQEPGDLNSPLLRSQIDANFLRTMVAQRAQMREKHVRHKKQLATPPKAPAVPRNDGQPPAYPRSTSTVPRHIHGIRRQRYYPWWNGSAWEHTPPPPGIYADNSSVQSGLSADSYHQPHYDYPTMYPMQPYLYGGIQPPVPPSSDNSSNGAETFNNNNMHGGMYEWPVDPGMYGYMHRPDAYYPPPSPGYYHPMPVSEEPQSPPSNDEPRNPVTSPYWAHLDQATLSMGLATPAKASPSTPRRNKSHHTQDDTDSQDTNAAQGPLVRQHYYGFAPPYAVDGYAPPSPATQFMMSPQTNFCYGYSPHRQRPRRKLSPLPREHSPSTVETTTTETESQVE